MFILPIKSLSNAELIFILLVQQGQVKEMLTIFTLITNTALQMQVAPLAFKGS